MFTIQGLGPPTCQVQGDYPLVTPAPVVLALCYQGFACRYCLSFGFAFTLAQQLSFIGIHVPHLKAHCVGMTNICTRTLHDSRMNACLRGIRHHLHPLPPSCSHSRLLRKSLVGQSQHRHLNEQLFTLCHAMYSLTASFDRMPSIDKQSVTAPRLMRVSKGVSVARLGEWLTSISTGLKSSVIITSMPKSSKHLRNNVDEELWCLLVGGRLDMSDNRASLTCRCTDLVGDMPCTHWPCGGG